MHTTANEEGWGKPPRAAQENLGPSFISGPFPRKSKRHAVDRQERMLLERLASGNADAQARFWQAQWAQTYAIACRILGTGAEANDVTVDVLHEFIFVRVQRLERIEAARSYLRLMVIRRALKHRERAKRTSALEDKAVPHDSKDVCARADDSVWLKQLSPRLNICLEGLTPKAQRAVRLRYTMEMTTKQIGEIVGGSKQYIGKLINKSLEHLKRCIDHYNRSGNERGKN